MNIRDKFKVGDRVRITKSSDYYSASKDNPFDCDGTVTKYIAGNEYTTEVDWDNGARNGYRDIDLELVA